MEAHLSFAFLAGLLSTLSPCVLPLLPVLLGSAIQQHRLAPLMLTAGVGLSFTAIGLLVASVGFAIGIESGTVRFIAAILMGVVGVILLIPRFYAGFAAFASGLGGGANTLLSRVSGDGIGGQFLLGLLLGAAWSPCSGPTLGAAVGLAAQGRNLGEAAIVMVVFSLGATLPLLELAYGSRQALTQRHTVMRTLAAWGKPVMGGMLVALSFSILSGVDRIIEASLTSAAPNWLIDLTTKY